MGWGGAPAEGFGAAAALPEIASTPYLDPYLDPYLPVFCCSCAPMNFRMTYVKFHLH
jgi:hypothetical protein